MEGRINRDSLTDSPAKPYYDYESRVSYRDHTSRKAKRGVCRTGGRRYRGPSRELLPEGKDLMMVQFLASGILLLFVMFVALVPSTQTSGVKVRLKDAFSYNMSVTEAVARINAIKESFPRTNNEASSDELADDTASNINTYYDDIADDTADDIADDIAIDSEMLKELNDKAEPTKN